MRWITLLGSVVALAVGAFLIVYGGIDDSPGAQLLGTLIILGGVVYIALHRKR